MGNAIERGKLYGKNVTVLLQSRSPTATVRSDGIWLHHSVLGTMEWFKVSIFTNQTGERFNLELPSRSIASICLDCGRPPRSTGMKTVWKGQFN